MPIQYLLTFVALLFSFQTQTMTDGDTVTTPGDFAECLLHLRVLFPLSIVLLYLKLGFQTPFQLFITYK